jgi:hypothetical protein
MLVANTANGPINLKCFIWAIKDGAKSFRTLTMKIQTDDGRELHFIYDGNDCVRAINLQEKFVYNVWGRTDISPGLPDLEKFFSLEKHTSN